MGLPVRCARICHDANGNLTADGTWAYQYDVENRLVRMRARVSPSLCPTNTTGYTGAIEAQLEYDPMGRLYEVNGYNAGVLQSTTQLLYDGDALVAEYSASGAMLARYLHGPAAGVDDPLVSFAGSSTHRNDATYLYSDARGSIVYSTDRYLTAQNVNTYDPYGVPGSTNSGRFQYTGQIWLDELGLYYYKARVYSPTLGRFLQTDPIGYEDNSNLYAYVGNDPINLVDPTGEESACLRSGSCPTLRGRGDDGQGAATLVNRTIRAENETVTQEIEHGSVSVAVGEDGQVSITANLTLGPVSGSITVTGTVEPVEGRLEVNLAVDSITTTSSLGEVESTAENVRIFTTPSGELVVRPDGEIRVDVELPLIPDQVLREDEARIIR